MGAEPNDGFRRVLVSTETEIKFAVEKGRKTEGMGEGTLHPATYETLYFDTDNLDLRRHRVELCVRKRDGQIIQKIKTRQANGGLIGCQSHEIVLSDLEPNLEHARALFAPDLRDLISRAALKPRFRTSFSRISRQFATDSCLTCASFDEGCIEANGRSELISEVEFKLKGGRLESYTQECLSFLAEVPAALLIESKAARGYRLAAGELPHAVGAPHLVVPWNLPMPKAIMRILHHGFQHFLDNYPAVTLAGEPEGIHQMRVAMRRMLSAIRMFAPVLRLEDTRALFQALKTIFSQLGGVREADVFITEMLPPLGAAGLGKTLESVLRREVAAFRAAAYQRARAQLTSAEFARLVVQLNDWIESRNWLKAERPIDVLLVERATEDFAVPRIRALHAKLLKEGAKARYGTLDDWHRTRIAAKRLRYAGEPLFQILAPNIDTERLSKQLNRLQNSLGRLNDLQSITPFLARVRLHVQGRSRRNFEAAEHFCRGWAGVAAANLVDHAEEAMRGFERIQLDASA